MYRAQTEAVRAQNWRDMWEHLGVDVFQTLIPVAAELSADTNPFIATAILDMKCNIILILLLQTWGKGLGSKNSFFQWKLDFSLQRTGFFTAENWIFQHFTCSMHCSHWPLLHLEMELVGNTLLPHFYLKKKVIFNVNALISAGLI